MNAPSPNVKKARFAFELWDNESGNLIGAYATEEDALTDVNETMCAYGSDYAKSIALLRVGPRGGLTRISTGPELAERARKAAAEAGTRSAIGSRPQGSPRVLREQSER